MTKEVFLANLADILFTEKAALEPQASLHNFQGWDSMGQVAVLALIDEADTGVEVPLNWLSKCQQVGQILELIEPHLEK